MVCALEGSVDGRPSSTRGDMVVGPGGLVIGIYSDFCKEGLLLEWA